jgi:hypothetical protein
VHTLTVFYYLRRIEMSDKITEAVLALRGVLPKAIDLWFEVAGTYYSSGISGDVWLSKEVGESSTRICGKFEFLQRAKVLGFVEQTGYRWGVEYEAHGVKPELPDVQIEILISNSEWGRCYVNEFNWNDLNFKYFRIVDERYKPTTTEATSDKQVTFRATSLSFENPDTGFKWGVDEEGKPFSEGSAIFQKGVKFNEAKEEAIKEMASNLGESVGILKWFDEEAGVSVSYPPAGTKCEVMDDGEWRETYIVGFDADGYLVYETPWDQTMCYNGHSTAKVFRPLGWNEERKVEAKVREIIKEMDFKVAHDGLHVLRELVRKGKIK